jgi:hypothetical protein
VEDGIFGPAGCIPDAGHGAVVAAGKGAGRGRRLPGRGGACGSGRLEQGIGGPEAGDPGLEPGDVLVAIGGGAGAHAAGLREMRARGVPV